jgi:hypothetical protein
MSSFGVWVAWQRSRRERLGETHTDYRRISAPEVRSHRRLSPEIQWGDDDQYHADDGIFSSNATDDRPHCPLCQQPIYQSDEHCCPNCKEKYHKPCWAEYDKTCVICGKAEN